MKNNHNLHRITILATGIVLSFWISLAKAQGPTMIYEHDCPSEKPFIKNYQAGIDIKYEIQLYGGIEKFYYVNRYANAAIEFEMPGRYGVRDFEITANRVYFCGTNRATTRACFGYFNIDSVFFLNGNVHVVELQNINVDNDGDTVDYIYSFSQMALNKVDTTIHLMLVGQGYREVEHHFDENTSVFMDAWLDAGTTWNYHYTAFNRERHRYTDVAVTANYVVVVGEEIISPNTLREQQIMYLQRQPLSASHMSVFDMIGPSSILPIPHSITNSNIANTYSSDPIIVAMKKDTFATVCSDADSISSCHVISIFDSPGSNPVIRYKFADVFGVPNSLWFEGICFDNTTSTIGLVKRNGENSGIYLITNPYDNITRVRTGYYTWRSIDRERNTGCFTVAGTTFSYSGAKLWLYNPTSQSDCTTTAELNRIELSREQEHVISNSLIVRNLADESCYSVECSRTRLKLICK